MYYVLCFIFIILQICSYNVPCVIFFFMFYFPKRQTIHNLLSFSTVTSCNLNVNTQDEFSFYILFLNKKNKTTKNPRKSVISIFYVATSCFSWNLTIKSRSTKDVQILVYGYRVRIKILLIIFGWLNFHWRITCVSL